MNIMHNMFALYNDTARDDTYHKALEGLFKNLDQIEHATIFELAELCKVSKATVERLIRKLGYNSLPQFRHDVSLVYNKYTYYNRVLPPELCQDDPGMLQAYFRTMREIIDNLENSINLKEVHRVTDALHQAKRVCFYTFGRYFAEIPLQINLAMSGKDTIVLPRYYEQLEDAKTLNSDCLAFIFTVDFHIAMDMMPVFTEAAKHGAKIALVTTNEVSQYNRFADFTFVSQFTETMVSDYGMQMNMDLINSVYRKKYIDQA